MIGVAAFQAVTPFGPGLLGLGQAAIVDDAAVLTAAGFLVFCVFAALFARESGRERTRGRRLLFRAGVALQLLAATTLPFAADLLQFFILWELVSLGAVAILLCESGRLRLLRIYLPIQIAAAVALIVAIALHSVAADGLLLPASGGLAAGQPFALFAVLVKAAVFPLHIWMVQTYPRVSPASTVILSAFGTKSGVFAAYRLLPGLAGLELFGALSALLAVLYALRQRQLRPFLTFHIASQIGYMIAGIGGVAAASQLAGVYHLSNHVMYKGLLLMTAAVLVRRFGTEDMYAIRSHGASTNGPLFAAALIGALAISGVPPFNGFVSKALLKAHAGSAASYWLMVAASVGTAMSFTKFLWLAFLGGHIHKGVQDEAAPPLLKRWSGPAELTAMGALATLCISMTVLPVFLFPELQLAYPFSRASIIAGLWPAALGCAGYFLFYPQLLRVFKLLPDGRPAGQVSLEFARGVIRTMRSLHSGDLRDSIAWMLTGLILVWLLTLVL